MAKFEIYPDSAGNYRWRLIANNNVKVASSGEAFYNASGAKEAAETVKRLAPTATI